MRLFLCGDFASDNGPAIANRLLKKGMGTIDTTYSKQRKRVFRTIEMCIYILRSDAVCFCSATRMNIFGIKLAKRLHKKIFYIMHGDRVDERIINTPNSNEKNMKKLKAETYFIYEQVDRIFCVSKKFMNTMKAKEPSYAHKFDVSYNSLDLEALCYPHTVSKKTNQIVSIGGGMRRKNNRIICEAIQYLHTKTNMRFKYLVIGQPYTDKAIITQYDFVEYHDALPHQEILRILSESTLYIQNSTFETFGLAIFEALMNQCSLLVSQHIGALELIDTLEPEDIIEDVNDVIRIAGHIQHLITHPNHQRIISGIQRNHLDPVLNAKRIRGKMESML